jgi:hypothetical protein
MITACPIPGKLKSTHICAAFIEGAPRPAVGFVFYGVNETNLHQYRVAKASGQPVYVIDNSAFDCVRGTQFRVTRGRYHHNGVGVSDGARFKALGIEAQPWQHRTPDRPFVLAVEQSESYMRSVAGDARWLGVQLGLILSDAVLVRAWNRDKREAGAAAVEALLAGVAVRVSPMSPCYGIMSRQQELRQDMFNVLADNQWTLDEIRNGTAWKALNA